jgi:DNA-binding NtrC family response regulator
MGFNKSSIEPTADGLRTADDNPRLFFLWSSGSCSAKLPEAGESVTVGRSSSCSVSIEHSSVSRHHATIHGGEALAIEDLGSSNGTWKNDERLPPNQRTPFGVNDVVRIGNVGVVIHGVKALRASQPSMPVASRPAGGGPVVVDAAMQQLHRLARTIAASPISVILRGETGVGKEVLAETIHASSPRAGKPFVRLNCAAFAEQLLEAELFGYEKGAFTGAASAKPGLLESGDTGTVFLDEVGEMSLATQAKLLRALANGEVLRVGSVKPRTIDVRFIAATHRDLEALVKSGGFREDLYFRLDGISLTIPPLRERPREIPILAREFIARACARAGIAEMAISDTAGDVLARHGWPGNIRELKNVIERAVVLSEGATILPEHLGLRAPAAAPSAPRIVDASAKAGGAGPLNDELARVERERIAEALRTTGGNQTAAAKLLGISRRTLVYRLSALNLDRSRER